MSNKESNIEKTNFDAFIQAVGSENFKCGLIGKTCKTVNINVQIQNLLIILVVCTP